MCTLGHNEDSQPWDFGKGALVSTSWAGREWSAYTYLGDLPTGAFGWSPSGRFAFSLNYVAVQNLTCPGVGRGFVARAMLDAKSMDDALDLASSAAMSFGHNYNLMRTEPAVAGMVNLEAAPRGLYAVRPVTSPPFFHANSYQTLHFDNAAAPDASTTHRLARHVEIAVYIASRRGVLMTAGTFSIGTPSSLRRPRPRPSSPSSATPPTPYSPFTTMQPPLPPETRAT
jgi:hypothetical protein